MKMERMGLRTVIILSVVLSSLLRPVSLEYYVDSDSNCLKDNSSIDITYLCPKENEEIGLLISSTNEVTLDCVNGISLDREILPKLNLTEYISFELNYCDSNVSFYEILSKFNMNRVKYLAYRHLSILEDVETPNVTKEMFEHMESIEYLSLEDVRRNLSLDFLENTPNLRELSLTGNGLTQISKYFNHVPKLESLDLSYNEIHFIPDGAFEYLEHLVELQASHNNLTSITKNTFKGLKSLKVLWLEENYIENIEEESFADMHKLVNISLHSNNIQDTHRYLFKNNKLLENINLGHNPNLVLPDYLFANLTSLQTIDLSFNNLRVIPENTFSNCCKLRYLTLKENRLSTIPEKTFLNLTSLKKLDISNNLLETLSDQLFSSLHNLEELHLSNNQLTALDSDIFHKMKKLKILNLSRNNISFIHFLAFRGLKYLIHLDLSYNQLNSTFDINYVFDNCENLEELILRKNKIREYSASLAFWKLKKLDLSSNLIEHLWVSDFFSPSDLKLEVDLRHNEIQYVDFKLAMGYDGLDVASHYTGLRNIIHLEDNPIACDCSNIDLIRYNNNELEFIKNMVDIRQDKLTCSDKKNILVTDLEPNQISCPCPSPCTCTYNYYKRTVIVDCSFKNLTSYPEFSINDHKYQQTILNLRGNHLNTGPVENSNYENVTYLDLSQNDISEMSWIPPNIKELNLEDNHLRKLDSHLVNLLMNRTSPVQIHLGDNPWECNCDLQKFLLQYIKRFGFPVNRYRSVLRQSQRSTRRK